MCGNLISFELFTLQSTWLKWAWGFRSYRVEMHRQGVITQNCCSEGVCAAPLSPWVPCHSSILIVFLLNPKDLGFPAKDLVFWYWISLLLQEINPTWSSWQNPSRQSSCFGCGWKEVNRLILTVNFYLDSTVWESNSGLYFLIFSLRSGKMDPKLITLYFFTLTKKCPSVTRALGSNAHRLFPFNTAAVGWFWAPRAESSPLKSALSQFNYLAHFTFLMIVAKPWLFASKIKAAHRVQICRFLQQ